MRQALSLGFFAFFVYPALKTQDQSSLVKQFTANFAPTHEGTRGSKIKRCKTSGVVFDTSNNCHAGLLGPVTRTTNVLDVVIRSQSELSNVLEAVNAPGALSAFVIVIVPVLDETLMVTVLATTVISSNLNQVIVLQRIFTTAFNREPLRSGLVELYSIGIDLAAQTPNLQQHIAGIPNLEGV